MGANTVTILESEYDELVSRNVSLRDYFAAAALTGLLAGQHNRVATVAAEYAYEMADAMLAERNKKNV